MPKGARTALARNMLKGEQMGCSESKEKPANHSNSLYSPYVNHMDGDGPATTQIRTLTQKGSYLGRQTELCEYLVIK